MQCRRFYALLFRYFAVSASKSNPNSMKFAEIVELSIVIFTEFYQDTFLIKKVLGL